MRYELFKPNTGNQYEVAVLLKASTFRKDLMQSYYADPLVRMGVPLDQIIAMTLEYDDAKKVSAKTVKEYLPKLGSTLNRLGTKYLYVCDATYFKALTGMKKADIYLGYVLPCVVPGAEHMQVVYGINYQQLVFAEDKRPLLTVGLKALTDHKYGRYQDPGTGIIHGAFYPDSIEAIRHSLNLLKQYPRLTCDIEAFGLGLSEAGIGTIAFAYDKHHFHAFKVDLMELPFVTDEGHHCVRRDNEERRALLREFFETYEGSLIFHHAVFDVKHIVYNLWMDDPLDLPGQCRGIDIMSKALHCTRVMAYLATNSCAGNNLKLKFLAQSFAGNYAVDDIHDIRLIPTDKLLEYNGVDCLSTFWLAEKMYPIMRDDQQLELYNGLFRDSLTLLIDIELSGMPMCPRKITETKVKLEGLQQGYWDTMMAHPLVPQLNLWLQTKEMDKKNASLKNTVHPITKWSDPNEKWYVSFNPGSGQQLAQLLYEFMELPILDLTDTGQPATGSGTIEKLLDHDKAKPHIAFLKALMDWSAVSKILAAFMPAFENGQLKADGMKYLHGAFNLGGTKSGRLSSSDPNMQNIPAGSAYGKLVKELFMAAKGWVFAGADFNSLEDYISALTTKDPNKLKVYEEGFDGHSLRAAFYFKEDLEALGHFIDLKDPKSVNSIKDLPEPFRQDSKAPTFLLTYGGTYMGMMKNLGWPEAKAKRIEKNYHDLYKVSDEYIAARVKQAETDGYVTVAFGLRLRTPALKKSLMRSKTTPAQAKAEGRTAGNAMGQSYGLLNNRAAVAFRKRLRASPYRYDCKIVALIHDAIYLVMRQKPEVIEWVNNALVEEMSWQELPELQHPTVKIGAQLDLFYPSWAHALTLPVAANQDQIVELCAAHIKKVREKEAKAA